MGKGDVRSPRQDGRLERWDTMTSEADRQRRARSSAALRENLKRRKTQVRARTSSEADAPGTDDFVPPNAENSAKPPPNTDGEPV
jgi:hypothetical protein